MKILVVCLHCNREFEACRSTRKFCSHACCAKHNMAQKHETCTVERKCRACNSQFEVTLHYASKQFCSVECRSWFRRCGASESVMKLCAWCKREFDVKYKFRCMKYCSRSCASKNSWNLGKTVETDEKMRAIAEKGSATRAERIVAGACKIVTRGVGSFFNSKKAGRVWCRSTWERAYCEKLEADSDVLTFKVEPMRIPYEFDGKRRNYVPDFLVIRVSGAKQLVEVKPASLTSMPSNVAKFEAARELCSVLSVEYIVVCDVR